MRDRWKRKNGTRRKKGNKSWRRPGGNGRFDIDEMQDETSRRRERTAHRQRLEDIAVDDLIEDLP